MAQGTSYGSIRLPAMLKPRNVEQITKTAQEYDYDASVSMRYYLRTAATLLKEADIYEREGDDEQAYFLLFRHAHLILANVASHRDLRDGSMKIAFAEAQREVNRNLKRLDQLKPGINDRYDKYVKLVRTQEARKAASSREDKQMPPQLAPLRFHQEPLIPDSVLQLQAGENRELAVRLAQKEISRRAAVRRSTQSAGNSRNEGGQPQRTSGVSWQGEDSARDDGAKREGQDLSHRLQEIRARIEPLQGPTAVIEPRERQVDPAQQKPPSYNYPPIPVNRADYQIDLSNRTRDSRPYPIRTPSIPSIPPQVPPKPRVQTASSLPPRPEKLPSEGQSATESSPNPSSYTFTPTAYLENGTPLRTLFLPPGIRTTFLSLALENTLSNLETCAFLAGTLISNALFVSKLIVPAQTATSDTCEMTHESQLFDYVDSEPDLMVLGWIHTHPTQTCFMSSRDLHTHAGYQMMLAESVAVVCAPSKGDAESGGDWGIFRLTDPPGKKAILACEKPGVFHPHDVDNVYTDALRPGHVVEARGLEFEVVDLRDGGNGR